MNKHIKHIKELLQNPTWDKEDKAIDYLKESVDSGEFKPEITILYQPKRPAFGSQAVTLYEDSIKEYRDLGFTIYGLVHEDYYRWVNFFLCFSDTSDDYVVGDFEDVVYASSKTFYDKFTQNIEIEEWDYHDI